MQPALWQREGKKKLAADLNELALSTRGVGGANPMALLNFAGLLANDLRKMESPEAYLMNAPYDKDINRHGIGKKVLFRMWQIGIRYW